MTLRQVSRVEWSSVETHMNLYLEIFHDLSIFALVMTKHVGNAVCFAELHFCTESFFLRNFFSSFNSLKSKPRFSSKIWTFSIFILPITFVNFERGFAWIFASQTFANLLDLEKLFVGWKLLVNRFLCKRIILHESVLFEEAFHKALKKNFLMKFDGKWEVEISHDSFRRFWKNLPSAIDSPPTDSLPSSKCSRVRKSPRLASASAKFRKFQSNSRSQQKLQQQKENENFSWLGFQTNWNREIESHKFLWQRKSFEKFTR